MSQIEVEGSQAMFFRILGPLAAAGLSFAPRQRTVLAMLLLDAGRVVAVDRLVDAVWDANPPSTAREQIQICVSAIRRALRAAGRPDAIVRQAPGYVLRCAADELDLLAFDRLVAEARESDDETRAAALLREALGLWRGTPIDGVSSRVVDAARVTLAERRICVLEEHVDLQLRLGAPAEMTELAAELAELVAAHPFRERLRAQLMTALHRTGRRAEALAVGRAGRKLLVDELGLDPGADLVRIEQAILAGPGPATPPVPATPLVPRSLPPTSRDFTGRADDLARLHALLAPAARGTAPRVVTLDGRAWIGKTMLAVHAAHALREHFPDGQLFARLGGADGAPVAPAVVLAGFLRALSVPAGAVPADPDERAARYRDLTADRSLLVVLDDAADERQVDALLPGSASCAVLVTSRRRLTALAGAWRVAVGPLTAGEGTRLLAEVIGRDRALAQAQDTRRLAEACHGEPLALRRAGARLAARPHWTVAASVDRLTGLDDDLEAELAEVHSRLSVAARRLLRRIGAMGRAEFPTRLCPEPSDVDSGSADDAMAELVDAGLLDLTRAADGEPVCRVGGIVLAFARTRERHPDRGGVVLALPTARAAHQRTPVARALPH
ncbi:AfsR/SARP family transcriptional regulator [Labedaea rhizosphaerae]|uniref:DNA-binding SARP family transcriptional activator n=1 Tax=Labedaea rhizosphaerae TaxID=598644 RepID=A0A4R6RSN2_LABRH|nr:AfsR/SARP family transcriptional regulator [Labedaea rhizosphaerae]TDP89889.1 DNA-binding SARP family transcriptional activator [Labedaea rhizosphaerae]